MSRQVAIILFAISSPDEFLCILLLLYKVLPEDVWTQCTVQLVGVARIFSG